MKSDILWITSATSVLRAGGGDKHNLISVYTRTKILQSIDFVFCSTPLLAFKNHSRGTLVIPESGQSTHMCQCQNWPRWCGSIVMREEKEPYFKYLSINSSKQCIRYEYFTDGTTNHQLPLFWLIFLSSLNQRCNNGDSEWMRYCVFRQPCRGWFVNRETETFHNVWRKIHKVIPG